MARVARGIGRIALCLATALLLGGGGFIASDVSAVAGGVALEDAALRDGIYCPVNPDGSVATGESACTRTWIGAGRLNSEPIALIGSGQTPPISLALVRLGRGVALAESPAGFFATDGGGGRLVLAMLTEDAFALLAIGRIDDRARARAAAHGVTLAPDPGPAGVRIVAGDPEAARSWLADVIGARFDRALRDPVEMAQLRAESLYVVRVAPTDAPAKRDDPKDVAARLAELDAQLSRAIMLE